MEYVNDFLYFVIKPIDGEKHIYCSGVNLTRFSPITKGKHRLGQNPASKGLQSLNNEVRSMIISFNATPETIKNLFCQHIKPLKDELWYTESFIIHRYTESLGEAIIKFAPYELINKILKATLLNETPPKITLSPNELEEYLYELAKKG